MIHPVHKTWISPCSIDAIACEDFLVHLDSCLHAHPSRVVAASSHSFDRRQMKCFTWNYITQWFNCIFQTNLLHWSFECHSSLALATRSMCSFHLRFNLSGECLFDCLVRRYSGAPIYTFNYAFSCLACVSSGLNLQFQWRVDSRDEPWDGKKNLGDCLEWYLE